MEVDEKYVIEAARQAGLELDPERLRAVLGNLQRIAQLARPVLEIELGPEDELGPQWKP
jgi:Asp-tRNA(Asn)/Glu-tRNA(Gln) amidotransferase C subunit